MVSKGLKGRRFHITALILISAAVLISCAGKDAQDTTEPVVADEASIPVQATVPEPEESFSPDLIKKTEHDTVTVREVIEVQDLETEVQSDPDQKPKPKRAAVNTNSGSIDDSWFLVADITGNKIYKVYVDTNSIETAADGVQSWSKLEFEATQRDEDGLSYDEVHIESSIDCEERTYAYNTSKFYNKIGQLVYQEDIEYNRTDITPDTLSAFVADFVCGYDFEEDS